MPFGDHDHVVKAFPTNRANHLLAYAFCHGERGAITASRISNVLAWREKRSPLPKRIQGDR